jgi:hypothetical protein
MVDITLILDRSLHLLWIDIGEHVGMVDDVTGVKRIDGKFRSVLILRRGKKVGMMWEVEEIKERWLR